MWGFCKRKAHAPRGRYTNIHEERLAMDAIYAAKTTNEKEEDDAMLEYVKVLTDWKATPLVDAMQEEPLPVLVKEVDDQLEMLLNEEEMIELSYGKADPLFLLGRYCNISHVGGKWRIMTHLGCTQDDNGNLPRFDHAYIVAGPDVNGKYGSQERVVLLSQMRNVL